MLSQFLKILEVYLWLEGLLFFDFCLQLMKVLIMRVYLEDREFLTTELTSYLLIGILLIISLFLCWFFYLKSLKENRVKRVDFEVICIDLLLILVYFLLVLKFYCFDDDEIVPIIIHLLLLC